LVQLIDSGIAPVVAPLTHDGKGQLLNTNADTVASAIASALAKEYHVRLYYIMDRKGVLSDPNDLNSVISELKVSNIPELHEKGIITDGMIPKLHNAQMALEAGAAAVYITNIKGMFQPELNGTTLSIDQV